MSFFKKMIHNYCVYAKFFVILQREKVYSYNTNER